ncbi:UNVERIFIED_CONTAM: hypothetical protein GTU68_031050 [Idotea baltica]|nr:hypothetical protein [Idotea baltica]
MWAVRRMKIILFNSKQSGLLMSAGATFQQK